MKINTTKSILTILTFVSIFHFGGNVSFAQTFTAMDIMGDTGQSRQGIPGDFNEDGHMDIYVPNGPAQQNKLWLGDGIGNFTANDILGDMGWSYTATSADFNADGHLDIYVGNINGEQNKLWLGDGTGNFTSNDIVGDTSNFYGVTSGDVDGDGAIDIYGAVDSNGQNKLWINDGTGNFTANDIVGDSGNSKYAAMGDVDNDGDLDIHVANQNGQNKLWLNDGTGNFTAGDILGDSGSQSSIFGDVNNDGNLDLYTIGIPNNHLWLGDGTGNFTANDIVGDPGNAYRGAMADLNLDGSLDIYVASPSQNKLWLGDGSGNFTASDIAGDNRFSFAATIVDFTADGKPDIYVSNFINQQNNIWINTSTAVNQAPTNLYINDTNAAIVNENALASTFVGTLSTTDPNASDTHMYSLNCQVTGVDDNLFEISANVLQTAQVFDFENPVDKNTDGIYEVCIRTTDDGGLIYDATITVTISDVNLAPTSIKINGNDFSSINENTAANTLIGTLTNTDDGEDTPEIYTYSFGCAVPQADEAHFTITANELQNSTVFDFENPVDDNTDNVYNICIVVTEVNGELSYEEHINITVNDITETDSSSNSGKSGKSSTIRYVCKDKEANNYSVFGRHKSALCNYTTETVTVLETETLKDNNCPIFTQRMKIGDRDGITGQHTQQTGVSPIVNEVKLLQETLNNMGINAGIEDGIFGIKTQIAVKAWQNKHYNQVLKPWGLKIATGNFYKSSERWMNKLLGCNDTVVLDNGILLN
ncbi:MAG: FG-GAP-like repeat-containing protein [Winogradskyella sp.]